MGRAGSDRRRKRAAGKPPSSPEWPRLDLNDPKQRATLAIVLALTLANIVVVSLAADKGVERVIFPYPQTFLQQLLSGSNDNANTEIEKQRMVLASLPEDALRALRFMALMDRMKNGESMMVMPFDVRVR